MIVDTSALIAVLRKEPQRDAILSVLKQETGSISAGSLLEAVVVATKRLGRQGVNELFGLIDVFGIEVVPTDRTDAEASHEIYARFGKGMGHPAQLNFGDCFAYALAKRTGEPLLCTGKDFAQTDLELMPLP